MRWQPLTRNRFYSTWIDNDDNIEKYWNNSKYYKKFQIIVTNFCTHKLTGHFRIICNLAQDFAVMILKSLSLRLRTYTQMYTLCSFILTNWTDEPASNLWDILSRTKIKDRLLPLRQPTVDIPFHQHIKYTTHTHTKMTTNVVSSLLCSLPELKLLGYFFQYYNRKLLCCACWPKLEARSSSFTWERDIMSIYMSHSHSLLHTCICSLREPSAIACATHWLLAYTEYIQLRNEDHNYTNTTAYCACSPPVLLTWGIVVARKQWPLSGSAT